MGTVKWFDIVFWLGVLFFTISVLFLDNSILLGIGITIEIAGILSVLISKRSAKKTKLTEKPKTIAKEVKEKKKEPVKELPKTPLVIGSSSNFYKKNITYLVIAIVVVLTFIIWQLASLDGKPSWYMVLLIFNFIILILLFVFSTYLLKRKKDIELEKKPIAEAEQELIHEKKVSKFKVLRHYVRKAIEKDFSREEIVKAALTAGWPPRLIEKAYKREITRSDIISSLIKGYETRILKRYIKKAVDAGFKKDDIFIAAQNAGWPQTLINNSYDSIEGKALVFEKEQELTAAGTTEEEEKQTRNILRVTAKLIKHETDFDKLYNLVKKRGNMKLSEVSATFNISKKQAEEWGQILEDHALLELYYPVIGEPELRWKKSKATA